MMVDVRRHQRTDAPLSFKCYRIISWVLFPRMKPQNALLEDESGFAGISWQWNKNKSKISDFQAGRGGEKLGWDSRLNFQNESVGNCPWRKGKSKRFNQGSEKSKLFFTTAFVISATQTQWKWSIDLNHGNYGDHSKICLRTSPVTCVFGSCIAFTPILCESFVTLSHCPPVQLVVQREAESALCVCPDGMIEHPRVSLACVKD